MKFGSWTYDGNKINLTLEAPQIDLSTYQLSGEWDLIGKSMLQLLCNLSIDLTNHFANETT